MNLKGEKKPADLPGHSGQKGQRVLRLLGEEDRGEGGRRRQVLWQKHVGAGGGGLGPRQRPEGVRFWSA